jgi:sugar phosphate isomerase/epimerase
MKATILLYLVAVAGLCAAPRHLPNPFFVFEDGLGANRPEQKAEIARKIGFAGISFDDAKLVPERIKATEDHGLKFFFLYLAVDVSGQQPVYEPGFEEAIHLLSHRDTAIWLTIRGHGPEAEQLAVAAARHTADLAAQNGLRVALYPHYGFYVAKLDDALRIATQAGRHNLGVTFNLCHELRSGGGPDFRPLLERAMPYLYAVSINGADHTGDWDRLIQPLDCGDFDIKGLLRNLMALGYRGPIGLQCYGIKGDIIDNLQHSMQAWREMSSAAAQ